MHDYPVERLESIAGTGIFTAALLANADLIRAGVTLGDYHPFNIACHATYICDEHGIVISLIVWEWEADYKRAWIALSWTRADHRRSGFYSKCYADLQVEAKALGARRIESMVASTNTAMQACAEANHRQIVMHVFREVL